jgi:hypothetical protein
LGKVEEVTEELNNMYTVVGDIMSSVAQVAGYGDARCCGEKSRDDIRLGSTQSGLGKGLKDIHGQRYRGDLCGRVCSHTTAHG